MSNNSLLSNLGISRRSFVAGSMVAVAAGVTALSGVSFGETAEEPLVSEPADDGTWTFVDQNDNEVTVKVPVQRICCLQHHSLDMLCQLKQQDKVVGIMTKWQNNLGAYMEDVFPGIADMPQPGSLSEWNVEEIVALEPDVVIAASQANADAVQQIRDLGIPVVTVSLRGEGRQAEAQNPRLANADAAYTDGCEWAIKTLGTLCGVREDAEAIWDFCLASRALVDEAVGDIADEDRVRAFVPMQDNKTYGNDKYVGCQLLRAGAINVAAADIQGNGEYTAEQLAVWDPDVILVQDRYMNVYEDLTTNEQYAEIRAVKEGNVVIAPYWTKPWGNPDTDSMALGELWLAHTFYPEKVDEATVVERAKDFYESFYGIEFTGQVTIEA